MKLGQGGKDFTFTIRLCLAQMRHDTTSYKRAKSLSMQILRNQVNKVMTCDFSKFSFAMASRKVDHANAYGYPTGCHALEVSF